MVPDLYLALSNIQTYEGGKGIPRGAEESLHRALLSLSQVRYGTATWRKPVRH